ncbi:hypothetical protein WR25_26977 [Diploscapter pachys]|uniref:Uncharacterized protein n=1 Tax=Diploscapter pachys TaxID=2018661 RepID=A0A2A2KM54_9BILA|nr:hypothetical protein WR25_26977 [Diploscapter pachys]
MEELNSEGTSNIRRSTRNVESEEDKDKQAAGASPPVEHRNSVVSDTESGIFSNELSRWLGLSMHSVAPLRIASATSRSSSPPVKLEEADKEKLLNELRNELMKGTHSVIHLLETVIHLICTTCPVSAQVPVDLIPLLVGCYRRLLSCCRMDEEEWVEAHLLLAELGEESAHEQLLAIELSDSREWPELCMWKRFAWTHAHNITNEDIKLQYLNTLHSLMNEDEFLFTAKGAMCISDVKKCIDDLEKKHRITSVESLWKAKRYKQLCSILSKDISFSRVSVDEMYRLVHIWMCSLYERKKFGKYLQLNIRLLHFLLECDEAEFNYDTARDVLQRFIDLSSLSAASLSHSDLQTASTLLCIFISLPITAFLLPKAWIALYSLVDLIYKDVPTLSYLSELNSNTDNERMPRRELDVLMKAHEKMGEDRMCGADNGEFIILFMRSIKEKIFDDKAALQELLKSENGWIWANVQEEIVQCLHCAFGKYTKKRRMMFDHGSHCDLKTDDLYELVLPLAMPYPLPEHDDKERLGHDVVDLIQTKFSSLLEASEDRKAMSDQLDYWLRLNANREFNDEYKREWNCVEHESVLKTSVWYVMALNYFRVTEADKSAYYAKLFLTSDKSTFDNFSHAVICSAWVILGYQKAATVFQLSEAEMLESRLIESSFLPFRVAISIDSTSMNAHAQLASSIYQVATRLHRFGCQPDYINSLREDAARHFEKALQADSGGYGELQWMCYFFLAKLQLKKHDYNIVTVAFF